MIVTNINGLKNNDLIVVECSKCKERRSVKLICYKKKFKRTDNDFCSKCSINTNNISLLAKIKWTDPEYRSKMAKVTSSDVYKDKIRNSALKLWSNKEYRDKQLNIRTPEYNANMSKIVKSKWENDNYRNKIINSLNLKECKNKISNNSKKFWLDDNCRKLMIKRIHEHIPISSKFMKNRWVDPKFRLYMANIVNTNEYKKKISIKAIENWKNNEYRHKMALSNTAQLTNKSKIEIALANILKSLNIEYISQYVIGPWSFDFFLPKYKILIECQGEYWHNLPKTVCRDKAKSTYVKTYTDNKLYAIWEHEFCCESKVINYIKYITGNNDIINFDFKSTIIKPINNKEASVFLDSFHYASGSIGKIIFGCFIDDKFIAVCSFNNPVRKETSDKLNGITLELNRFCIHQNYQMKNFASFFLSKCIKLISNKCDNIVSFADNSYNHHGVIYKATNWKLIDVIKPDYWYISNDGWIMHKKTLWNRAKKMSITEKDYSEKFGYKKVFGSEKYKYLYTIKR